MNSSLITIEAGQVELQSFLTVTIGILVLFLGKYLNSRVRILREFTIPEPVTGGLVVALLIALLHLVFGFSISFGLRARDLLLVYFFTTVGINASFADLRRGGRSLVVLLSLTLMFMVAQNLVGITVARLFGLPTATGLIAGTVSLVGGHGTTIAWAPIFSADHGVPNAMEIGIACATFGLIIASATGGPIARFLIRRHQLKPPAAQTPSERSAKGSEAELRATAGNDPIDSFDFLGSVLAINLCIILGSLLQKLIEAIGLFLPLFVPCLMVGILLTNLLPKQRPGALFHWPSRTPALELLAEISLGAFLAMSLMSLQLWTLVDLAAPVFTILICQFILALLVNLFLVFPLLGGNYDAAVIAAGFGGITLGSTPTAMANMTAVTERFGPSYKAFIVVPLVSAFFIDLANAVLIPFLLRRL